MKKARSWLTTVLSVGFVGLLVASTAEGQGTKPDKLPPPPNYDVKTYHGSACNSVYWASQIVADELGVRNAYFGGPAQVICPVARDDAAGTDGVYMARITVYDDDPEGDISCTFVAFDKWNEEVASATAGTSGSSGNQILDLTIIESAEFGTYALWCDLPPYNSGTVVSLKAYRVYEFQDGYDGMTDYDN